MKKDVFISYASPDKEAAQNVVKYLEDNSINCFIAPRDVDPGKAYASNLMHAIDMCNVVVLIASDAMNNSEHVLNEVDVIVSKRKNLIPFFIEDFEMNDDYRYYLGRTHRIIAYPNLTSDYYSKLYDSIRMLLPHAVEKKPTENDNNDIHKKSVFNERATTVFNYLPERGIMINPEDGQRNISFRTDTFISMFGGIYESVVDVSAQKHADEIFHKSGYISGQNFAERLNDQWAVSQSSPSSFEEKLSKWCEFDSNVGWGKFSINVNVNEETGDFSGELSISECFIVDKKGKRHICEFIKGYCEGVIETLLCVKVSLKCITCPIKNRFKSVCKFNIELADN